MNRNLITAIVSLSSVLGKANHQSIFMHANYGAPFFMVETVKTAKTENLYPLARAKNVKIASLKATLWGNSRFTFASSGIGFFFVMSSLWMWIIYRWPRKSTESGAKIYLGSDFLIPTQTCASFSLGSGLISLLEQLSAKRRIIEDDQQMVKSPTDTGVFFRVLSWTEKDVDAPLAMMTISLEHVV